MTTPTKEQIIERATELFYRENPGAPTPEVYELKESSYYGTAQSELMRDESTEALTFIEQQAGELGRRVVTEEEHANLVDLAVRLEKLKEAEKQLKGRRARREAPLEPKTHKLKGTLEPMLEAARVRQLDQFEEVKQDLKELDQKINHRETNGKIKDHRKPASCASLRGTCRSKGLSPKGCNATLPLHCRRKRHRRELVIRKKRAASLLPSLPGFPTVA